MTCGTTHAELVTSAHDDNGNAAAKPSSLETRLNQLSALSSWMARHAFRGDNNVAMHLWQNSTAPPHNKQSLEAILRSPWTKPARTQDNHFLPAHTTTTRLENEGGTLGLLVTTELDCKKGRVGVSSCRVNQWQAIQYSQCLQRFKAICILYLQTVHSRRRTTFLVVLAFLWKTGLVCPP